MFPDSDWIDEAIAWEWPVPARPAPFWRWFGVRHMRAGVMLLRAYVFPLHRAPVWREMWRREWLARGILRGWC